MRIAAFGLGGTTLMALAAALPFVSAGRWDLVAGPIRTQHLALAAFAGGGALVASAAVGALARYRSGPERAWSTLLADGATSLVVLGWITTTALAGLVCAVSVGVTAIVPLGGAGGRYVLREDQGSFAVTRQLSLGRRAGLLVDWGAPRPASCSVIGTSPRITALHEDAGGTTVRFTTGDRVESASIAPAPSS